MMMLVWVCMYTVFVRIVRLVSSDLSALLATWCVDKNIFVVIFIVKTRDPLIYGKKLLLLMNEIGLFCQTKLFMLQNVVQTKGLFDGVITNFDCIFGGRFEFLQINDINALYVMLIGKICLWALAELWKKDQRRLTF